MIDALQPGGQLATPALQCQHRQQQQGQGDPDGQHELPQHRSGSLHYQNHTEKQADVDDHFASIGLNAPIMVCSGLILPVNPIDGVGFEITADGLAKGGKKSFFSKL